MITKSPVTKFKPWIYAVLCSLNYGGLQKKDATNPRPSFPARGFRTYCPFRHPERQRIYCFTHNFVLAIHLCQLLRNFLRSIWAIVIDNNNLPFKLTCKWELASLSRRQATYFSVNVLANNQTMTGKFLRSLYVGRMTLYLWVSEEWNEPCILRDALLSNGFIQVTWKRCNLIWILLHLIFIFLDIWLLSSSHPPFHYLSYLNLARRGWKRLLR